MTKKKPQVKSNTEVQRAETEGRITAFNREMKTLAEKYQVKLDVSMRIVVIDDKTSK